VTPEGKVKAKLRAWMKENFPGAWHDTPRGGSFTKAGKPDDVWLWNEIFIAIESKADRSNKPTQLQLLELKKIQDNGGIVAVLYGFEIHKLHEIKRRALRLASERRANAIRASEDNNEVHASAQAGLHSERDGYRQNHGRAVVHRPPPASREDQQSIDHRSDLDDALSVG
jgi:hypothetical protein